jgi:hypothetical protein
MKENNNLIGEIEQLTIFGQMKFIYGYNYKIIKSNDKQTTLVSGLFEIVNSDETIDLTIEMEKSKLKKHIK